MKTRTVLSRAVQLLMLSVLALACAKKNEGGGEEPSTPVVDTGRVTPDTSTNTGGGDPSTTDYWANSPGGSVPLTIDSFAVMNTYVGTHPINNPTNIRLYVELQDVGSGRWSGTVKIGYYDNGQLRTGVFSSENPNGYGYNRVSYKNWYVGKPNAEFNQWFTWNGKRVFHAFFQDAIGAVLIVIDGGLDLGDGGGMTELSGKVYFKNFRMAPAPQYYGGQGEQCWFLLPPSPYECGTFQVGEKVVTTSALYPSNGYTRLGTFTGLSKSRAFR